MPTDFEVPKGLWSSQGTLKFPRDFEVPKGLQKFLRDFEVPKGLWKFPKDLEGHKKASTYLTGIKQTDQGQCYSDQQGYSPWNALRRYPEAYGRHQCEGNDRNVVVPDIWNTVPGQGHFKSDHSKI